MNVELAAPHDFIPPLPGWPERCLFIRQEGPLALFHYDLYAQVLSKLERGHTKDLEYARRFLERGLVAPSRLLELFEAIEPELYRYPAVDPAAFREAVEELVRGQPASP